AGIDTALWDIRAKRAGKSVAALLGSTKTHVDVYGSSMDKTITHTVLDTADIRTAAWLQCTAAALDTFGEFEQRAAKALRYPMFVKPANAGSSVGVSKAYDASGLKRAVELALVHDQKVLIEEAVTGKEVECAVLGNEDPLASVVGEIAPKAEFYDYNAKYLNNSTDLYVPARIPETVAESVRGTAVRAFRALCCTGLARVDFFVRDDGVVVLNEVNTIPGFTHISMYPKLFKAYGIPYPALIDQLISLALERRFLI
ncbi:MAG: D-alanine--D-alanine ligase, partial [Acetanaerobacterium sp.]